VVLYWYSRDWPTNAVVEKNILDVLNAAGPPGSIEYYPESLESNRFAGDDQESVLHDYLKQKYAHRQIDVVIAVTDTPLRFLLKYRNDLFPNVPIVFGAVERPPAKEFEAAGGLTGVISSFSFRQTTDLALSLHPDTKQVFVVSGTIEHDKLYEKMAREKLEGLDSRVSITYLTDLGPRELAARTKAVPDHSLILYAWQRAYDEQGKLWETTDILPLIAGSAKVPIYGMASWQVGKGIVGGYVRNNNSSGTRIAEMAVQIAKGERPQNMPVEITTVIPMFDARELKRWGIGEQKLPVGNIVEFKRLTFWEEDKWYLLGAAAAILIEGALIAFLVITLRRERAAERERKRLTTVAESAHRRLDEIVSNVPGIVWESLADPVTHERTTTFISDHVQKMLGYTTEEWLAQPPGFGARILHEDDRERVLRESDEVFTSGHHAFSQFRWLAKDGRIVWAENYLIPITNGTGKVIGLRGVAIDISDRKQAEEVARRTVEKDVAILAAIPDLMFLQTRDGVYLDHHCSNPEDLLVPPEAFMGKNMRDILPPNLADSFAHCFDRAFETSEPQIVEYQLTLNDEPRWFEARVVASGENILSVIRDITERKRHAVQLADSHRHVTEILESIGDAFYSLDTDFRFTYVNRKTEEVWATRRQELIGRNFLEVFPQAIGTYSHQECLRAIDEGTPINFEAVSPILNRWLDTSVYPTPTGLSVYFRDVTERKQAAEALRESESRLRRAQEAARVATWELDIPTGEVVWSEMIWQFLGLEPGDGKATIERFGEFIHPDDRELAWRNMNRAIEHDGDLNDEFRIVRTNGEVLWLAAKARVIRSANGRAQRMIGVNIDITDQHRALDELRDSEERFAKAFRANPQPMSLTSLASGKYLDVNESFLQMSGYRRDEVIGKTSLELNIWGSPEAREEFVKDVKERGSLVNREAKFYTRDGSERTLLSSAERLEIDGKQCLLVASSDITERMLAQRALLESEARFRNMADTAPVMIWIADVNKNATYFNQQWLEFTGRRLEQEIGSGWTAGIHPLDLDGSMKLFDAAFDSREPFRMEYRLHRADGTYRWVIDSGTPRFSSTGEFLGYIGSSVDITDRKESEAALVFAHEALENAYGEVNQLKAQLQEQNIYLQEEIKLQQNFGEIVGASDALKYVLFKIEQVAPTDSTVLITGETGTGKELVARAIHTASTRRDRPMVKVNCAALSPSLIESELFGHEKGSFTGALARKIGRFELADGATLFLDEIGELPLELQVKLLRVIQEGEFERLGSSKTVKADVRIIAATNRNLKEQVNKGLFREDLWYRLNVFPITVPPLRQRRDDIPMLIDHFANTFSRKLGKEINSVAPATINALRNYAWPGNVRELANVIERAVINTHGPVLRVREQLQTANGDGGQTTVASTLEEVERDYIIRVLEDRGWRIEGPQGAAHVLGMNPSTLRTRMGKLGISKPNQQAARNGGT